MKKQHNKKRGLIAGYEPNRISLYLMYLYSNRLQELEKVLLGDMEKYQINPNEEESNLDGTLCRNGYQIDECKCC